MNLRVELTRDELRQVLQAQQRRRPELRCGELNK